MVHKTIKSIQGEEYTIYMEDYISRQRFQVNMLSSSIVFHLVSCLCLILILHFDQEFGDIFPL